MRKLVLAVAVMAFVGTAQAEESKTKFQREWHLDLFQPVMASGERPELLLGGFNCTFLKIGRFDLLGAGVGISSASPAGGLALTAVLASVRLKSYTGTDYMVNAYELRLSANYVYDTNTHFGGISTGISLGF